MHQQLNSVRSSGLRGKEYRTNLLVTRGLARYGIVMPGVMGKHGVHTYFPSTVSSPSGRSTSFGSRRKNTYCHGYRDDEARTVTYQCAFRDVRTLQKSLIRAVLPAMVRRPRRCCPGAAKGNSDGKSWLETKSRPSRNHRKLWSQAAMRNQPCICMAWSLLPPSFYVQPNCPCSPNSLLQRHLGFCCRYT